MITFEFNFNLGKFVARVEKGSANFSQIVWWLKSHYSKYDSIYRVWTCSNEMTTKYYMEELSIYTEIKISDEDKFLLDNMLYPKDNSLFHSKIKLDKDYFKTHPVLEGKSGYEKYQEQVIKYCLGQNKAIIDLGVGHGKSYIIITVLHHLLTQGKADKAIFICRPEGVSNIKLEILIFLNGLVTENDIGIVDTQNRNIMDFFDKKIIITNYNTFRLSVNHYQKLNKKGKKIAKNPEKLQIDFSSFGSNIALILDEVQSIKNPSAIINNSLFIHIEYFKYIYGMSGSLGYKMVDYYGVLRAIARETIPYSPSVWKNYMCDSRGNYRPERILEFKNTLLNKYIISFPDAIKVAPIYRKNIILDMTPEMRKLYMAFIEKFITQKRDKEGKEVGNKELQNAFFYLLQFTCTPETVKDAFGFAWSIKKDPKYDALQSIIEKEVDENNKKLIIWVSYPLAGNLLKENLIKYNPLLITGDVKNTVKREDRFEEVQNWRKDDTRKIAIFSYVLKTSINIPEATRVVYWDVNPDNDHLVQSSGRTRRANSTEQTIAYHLLYDKSIDIYVQSYILASKAKVKETMMDKKEFSLEELKTVFNSKYVDNYALLEAQEEGESILNESD